MRRTMLPRGGGRGVKHTDEDTVAGDLLRRLDLQRERHAGYNHVPKLPVWYEE